MLSHQKIYMHKTQTGVIKPFLQLGSQDIKQLKACMLFLVLSRLNRSDQFFSILLFLQVSPAGTWQHASAPRRLLQLTAFGLFSIEAFSQVNAFMFTTLVLGSSLFFTLLECFLHLHPAPPCSAALWIPLGGRPPFL